MTFLFTATIEASVGGDVSWRCWNSATALALGMSSVDARGTIGHDDARGGTTPRPEDVSVALEVLAIRLARLADAAAWNIPLFELPAHQG